MKAKKKESGQSILRTVILSIFVIIFFVGIVIFYYQMVYMGKRDNIIKDGELSSVYTAERFDKYLSTNIDSIKLSAYTIDSMIKNKKSDEEIQEFLVGQSTTIKSVVIENSTGLYAYINGRFFSGTNWVPPAIIPAPALLERFQNSAARITGPNVAPKPAHARVDTIVKKPYESEPPFSVLWILKSDR